MGQLRLDFGVGTQIPSLPQSGFDLRFVCLFVRGRMCACGSEKCVCVCVLCLTLAMSELGSACVRFDCLPAATCRDQESRRAKRMRGRRINRTRETIRIAVFRALFVMWYIFKPM